MSCGENQLKSKSQQKGENQQKLLEIEFRELFVTYREYIKIVTTLIGAFLAAYAGLLGIAFQVRSLVLYVISIIFPAAIGITIAFFGRLFGAIFFTALKFEKYIIEKEPLSFSILMILMLPSSRKNVLDALNNEKANIEIEKIRSTYGLIFPTSAIISLFFWIVGHIIFAGYLYWVSEWKA